MSKLPCNILKNSGGTNVPNAPPGYAPEWRISLLSLPRKMYAKVPRKKWNQSWMIRTAVFVAAVALQNKFPLPSNFSRNPGSMPKTWHMLCRSQESV